MNVLYLLGYVTYFLIIMSNIAYSSSLKVQCLHVMFKKNGNLCCSLFHLKNFLVWNI